MVHSFSPKLCHNLVRVNAQDIQGQVVLFQVNKFEEVNRNKCDHHLHRIGNNCIVTEVGGKTFKTMSMRKSMVSAATLFHTGGIV